MDIKFLKLTLQFDFTTYTRNNDFFFKHMKDENCDISLRTGIGISIR